MRDPKFDESAEKDSRANRTTTDMETNMRRFLIAGAVTVLLVGLWGCGGSDYSTGGGATPTSPTSASPNSALSVSPAGVVTVNVVAINGEIGRASCRERV